MTALVLLALPVAIASQPATQTEDVQAAVTLDATLPAPSLSQRYQRLRRLELASALVMGVSAVTFTATPIGLFNADYPGTALAAIVIGGGSTAGLYAVGLNERAIRRADGAVSVAPHATPASGGLQVAYGL
jgi:hypothetical protein